VILGRIAETGSGNKWRRLRVFGWNNLGVFWHLVRSRSL